MLCCCLVMLVAAVTPRHEEETPVSRVGGLRSLLERPELSGAGSLRAVMNQHLTAMLSWALYSAEASGTRAASMFINDCIGDAV